MNVQAQLNDQAIRYLPRVRQLILEADDFESNQMTNKVLQWVSVLRLPVHNMNNIEIHYLERDLIKVFKMKGWMK